MTHVKIMRTKMGQHMSFKWLDQKFVLAVQRLVIGLVIIAKLKTKSSKKVDTYKYSKDTGSDGNVRPTRMFKMLFPHTTIYELNKSINNKKVLHAYNN